MPYNGSGVFNRIYNWTADAAGGIKILASRMDGEFNGVAAGLSNCITRDGQSPPSVDLPMGGKKIVNMATPSLTGDAATKGYVDSLTAAYLPLAGGALTGAVTSTGIVDAAYLRSKGVMAPATGAGVELQYTGTIGRVLSYDRDAAAYKPLQLEGSTITIIGNSSTLATASSSAFNVTVPLQQSGSQVWHAANFDPTLKANLVSPALTGTPTAPTAAGGTNTTQLATTAFVTSGISTAGAAYALLAGATFSGAFGRDANFAFDIVSSKPRVTFDSGDYLEYDRTTNKLTLYIGSTAVLSVDSSGNLITKANITAAGTP